MTSCSADCLLFQCSADCLLFQCSADCGSGEQVAKAHCVDDMGNVWKASQCDKSSKVMKRVCNQGPCPQWATSEWKQVISYHISMHIISVSNF